MNVDKFYQVSAITGILFSFIDMLKRCGAFDPLFHLFVLDLLIFIICGFIARTFLPVLLQNETSVSGEFLILQNVVGLLLYCIF